MEKSDLKLIGVFIIALFFPILTFAFEITPQYANGQYISEPKVSSLVGNELGLDIVFVEVFDKNTGLFVTNYTANNPTDINIAIGQWNTGHDYYLLGVATQDYLCVGGGNYNECISTGTVLKQVILYYGYKPLSYLPDNRKDLCASGFSDVSVNGRYLFKGKLANNGYYLDDNGLFNYYQNGNYLLYPISGFNNSIPYQWWVVSYNNLGTGLYTTNNPSYVPTQLSNFSGDISGNFDKCPDNFGTSVNEASNDYNSNIGFSLSETAQWVGDNFILLSIGMGLGVLNDIKYWLVAIIVIGFIIYFPYRALKNKV